MLEPFSRQGSSFRPPVAHDVLARFVEQAVPHERRRFSAVPTRHVDHGKAAALAYLTRGATTVAARVDVKRVVSHRRAGAVDGTLATLFLSLMLSLCHAVPAAAPAPWVDVAGYQVDMRLTPKSQQTETVSNLRHQIEIVESAKLPAKVQSFFRTVPIVIDPALAGMNGQYFEMDGAWVVRARPGRWPPDRAILLHELLHAYQREVLGLPTPPVGRALQEALRDGTYPPDYKDAYFLSNGREYFAVIAEIYLAGPSFRPPYNCGNVRKSQPGFISYLATLFGERECK